MWSSGNVSVFAVLSTYRVSMETASNGSKPIGFGIVPSGLRTSSFSDSSSVLRVFDILYLNWTCAD